MVVRSVMDWVLSGCGRWVIIRDEWSEICFLRDIHGRILLIYFIYPSNFDSLLTNTQ